MMPLLVCFDVFLGGAVGFWGFGPALFAGVGCAGVFLRGFGCGCGFGVWADDSKVRVFADV